MHNIVFITDYLFSGRLKMQIIGAKDEFFSP